MGQATLFAKSKKEVEETEEFGIEEETIEVTDENGWSDYDHQEILNNKEEGHNYYLLDLYSKSDLSGISYEISLSNEYEPPNGFMGSCYGSGGEFDLENPKKYFDEVMKHKLDDQKEPYKKLIKELWEVEYHHSSDFYRLVPMKNYIVIVGKKVKEMLKEKGFDFEEWYKEYRAVPENLSTVEYDEGILVARQLLLKGSNSIKKTNLIKESIKYKLGETQKYGSDTHDYFGDIGIEKLMQELKEIQKEVTEINRALKKYFIKYRNDYEAFDASNIIEVI